MTAMQRTGTPEDIAALVSYLVSDQAQFVTGQSVRLLLHIRDETYLSITLHHRLSSTEVQHLTELTMHSHLGEVDFR
jgi:hypothetical protein